MVLQENEKKARMKSSDLLLVNKDHLIRLQRDCFEDDYRDDSLVSKNGSDSKMMYRKGCLENALNHLVMMKI